MLVADGHRVLAPANTTEVGVENGKKVLRGTTAGEPFELAVDEILVARVTHRAVRTVMGRRSDMAPEAWAELTGGRTDVDEWWSYALEPVDPTEPDTDRTVTTGITETNHGVLDYLVVASTEWLDGLKPDVRDQFLKILKEVTETRNSEVKKVDQDNRQKVAEAGSTIRTLTDEQRQAWVDAMKPVWKKFEQDIGTDLLEAAQKSNM